MLGCPVSPEEGAEAGGHDRLSRAGLPPAAAGHHQSSAAARCFHPLGQEGCLPLPRGWFPGLSPAGPHAPSTAPRSSCSLSALFSLCSCPPKLKA